MTFCKQAVHRITVGETQIDVTSDPSLDTLIKGNRLKRVQYLFPLLVGATRIYPTVGVCWGILLAIPVSHLRDGHVLVTLRVRHAARHGRLPTWRRSHSTGMSGLVKNWRPPGPQHPLVGGMCWEPLLNTTGQRS